MANLKGQNLRLFLDSKVVALCKSCKLNYANEYEDATTKDTPTGKKDEEYTTTNITISFDCLVGDLTDLKALASKMKSGAKVQYEVTKTTGTDNRTKDATGTLESGWALIDSLDIDATDRQNVSASGSLHDVAADSE